MPAYRIYRLKEHRRTSFRWAPHTCGATELKPKDYDVDGSADGATPYAAWAGLEQTDQRLVVGDLLESPDGALRIFKYVGFEEANWAIPDPAGEQEDGSAAGAQDPASCDIQ